MKRIKSAPGNIAEMINRKKPTLEKSNKKQILPIVFKQQVSLFKNQKNIEKTFNNIILDYINDKQLLSNNDEESLIISILYFYVCEKIFTKKNLREFILFVIQMFIRYIVTHNIHYIYIDNKELIDNKIIYLQHIAI